ARLAVGAYINAQAASGVAQVVEERIHAGQAGVDGGRVNIETTQRIHNTLIVGNAQQSGLDRVLKRLRQVLVDGEPGHRNGDRLSEDGDVTIRAVIVNLVDLILGHARVENFAAGSGVFVDTANRNSSIAIGLGNQVVIEGRASIGSTIPHSQNRSGMAASEH